MVSWSAGGEGEGDAPRPGPAHATKPSALWLRVGHPKRSHEGRDPIATHGGQKRRRAASSALPGDAGGQRHRAQAMSVALLDEGDDAGAAAVVDESPPHDDVDMGTPTAASAKHASWRDADADATREDVEVDDKWDRIRGSLQEAAAERRRTDEDAHTPPPTPPPRPLDDGVELLAFREYNDDDIDSLEILLSQDFGGGISEGEDSPATGQPVARLTQADSCAWHDYRDGTQQYEEEASEVFDNVIYAPRSSLPRAQQEATPPRRPPIDLGDMYESESELSDGFEVSLSFAPVVPEPPISKTTSSAVPPIARSDGSRPSSASSSRSGSSSYQWHARLSVKRDCSFIDCTAAKKQPLQEARVEVLSESGDDFGGKLKIVDRGDEDRSFGRPTTTKPSSSSSSTATTSAVKTEPSVPEGFCPRKKKRRKVRQLPLDTFLTAQPSAS